jgi:UPF0716 protein FxsA
MSSHAPKIKGVRPPMPLFLLLVAVPIIEIALFIEVGGWIGLWPTLAIVVLTAMAGTYLLRMQGLATLGELQRRLRAGEDPSPVLAHGAMVLVAGVLLLTPGFFTDALGLALLVPPVRDAVIRFLRARMTVVHAGASVRMHMRQGGPRAEPPGTIDGEYEVVEPEGGEDEPRGDSGWTRVPGEGPGR